MMDYKASHLHPNLWTSKVSKRCPLKEHCTVNSVVLVFTRNLQSSVDWVVHRVWRYLVLWLFIGLDTTFDLYCRRYAGVVGFDHPPMRKWWSRGQALHCWEQSSWCAEVTDALLFNGLPVTSWEGVWSETGSRAGAVFH